MTCVSHPERTIRCCCGFTDQDEMVEPILRTPTPMTQREVREWFDGEARTPKEREAYEYFMEFMKPFETKPGEAATASIIKALALQG